MIDEALDGKLDMIRRFQVDVRSLTSQKHALLTRGTAMAPEVRQPITTTFAEELAYDAHILTHTEVFAWDARISKMVRESSETLPLDIPFSRAWLYTPAGLWWFGRNDRTMILRSTEADPTGGEQRRGCCALTFWSQIHNPENISLWGYSYDHNEPSKGPVPITAAVLKAGSTLQELREGLMKDVQVSEGWIEGAVQEAREGLARQVSNVDDMGNVHVLHLARARKVITEDVYRLGLHGMSKIAWAGSTIKLVTFFLAGSLWIQQRILTTQTAQPTRQARRRAEKVQALTPRLSIIELRRREYVNDDTVETIGGTDYSCQWVVRGHWRNQACGSNMSERKPIWIDPYIKGPDDMPLKHTERVFVVRK